MSNKWIECLDKLKTGDYENNWPSHDIIRTGNPDFLSTYVTTPTFGMPIWSGEPVKNLIINADCGLGDTIQFVRFCKNLHATLICPCDLWSIFGNTNLNFSEEPLKGDAIIHIMALPYVLKIKNSEINGKPYLQEKYINTPALASALENIDKLKFTKIGLCLSGNPNNPRDKERSFSFEEAASLFDLGLPFFNFNKIQEGNSHLIPLPLYDFNHTAILLKKMECLITVDTAVAHLAGAIGVKTYLLLKDNPDWRWNRCWYDSIEIIRENQIESVKNRILAN